MIHSSRGKIVRAEPISALTETGKIHHVGAFPELEDQLVTFEPGSTDSPDRLDAYVFAFTELQVAFGNGGIIEWTQAKVEEAKAKYIGGSAGNERKGVLT